MRDSDRTDLIVRYTAWQRINHWFNALLFIALALSGLALFHPYFYGLTGLFGGGTWTRIIHPFLGVIMVVFFAIFAARMWRHNMLTRQDWRWMRQLPDVLAQREDRVPEQGKYNGGQKLMYFALILCLLVLLVTGIVMWRVYFTHLFPIPVVRLASVLHALFAFIMIVAIIVHIYAGFWVKGSVRSMTRGTVSPGWAWKHHRGWYRQLRRPNYK